MTADFDEINAKTVYEHSGVRYEKVSKAEGFQKPEAERFKVGKTVCWFVPVGQPEPAGV